MTLKKMNKEVIITELNERYKLTLDQFNKPYAIEKKGVENPATYKIGGAALRNNIRKVGFSFDMLLNDDELNFLEKQLSAQAQIDGTITQVFRRVAPSGDGIEIDLGDNQQTRISVQPGITEIIRSGSEILFSRNPNLLQFVMPSDEGDFTRIFDYLNMSMANKMLLVSWLTYTLAHPKIDTSKYVILVLTGDQGSGKTFLCNSLIRNLVDPSVIGVQVFPNNTLDFVLATQESHVLLYDNMRAINNVMSDHLCIASTSGALSTRQLYTDSTMHVHHVHSALVLNGIHSFIDQPDLAQRCLNLQLEQIPSAKRESESELNFRFKNALPTIFKGLLDLISAIFEALPDATVKRKERMIDFSYWLAAMESVLGEPAGALQDQYALALSTSIRESLMESPLASAILDFSEDERVMPYTSTPNNLLDELNDRTGYSNQRSPLWPSNSIALSKRLKGLQAALASQDIAITFSRGKERSITIEPGWLYE